MLSIGASIGSCERNEPMGFLHIEAPVDGHYDLYRIIGSNPIQFVTEQIGSYNEAVGIPPGTYLALADCSSETVVIYPGVTRRLEAQQVQFVPPEQPHPEDNFFVQCDRFSETKIRQTTQSRFDFTILTGRHKLLVANVPLEVDLVRDSSQKVHSFPLSALIVEAKEDAASDQPFFVSPADSLISVTSSQTFGSHKFLLPGDYVIELNGIRYPISLTEREIRQIKPAYLTVTTSKRVDLELSSEIRGNPILVEVNDGHWLELNETYPMFPGKVELSFSGSENRTQFDLEAGKSLQVKARSVTVHLECSPWDWTCLGQKRVLLYRNDQLYPFMEGTSDVPLLFVGDDAWLSVEGSRDIRYQLPAKKRDIHLHVGYVRLVPEHVTHPYQVTDLVRIEAEQLPTSGFTLDVRLEDEVLMPLIEGTYRLAHYVSLVATEGERRKSGRRFYIPRGEVKTLPYQVYVTEERLAQIHKLKEKKERRRNRAQRMSRRSYQPSRPIIHR